MGLTSRTEGLANQRFGYIETRLPMSPRATRQLHMNIHMQLWLPWSGSITYEDPHAALEILLEVQLLSRAVKRKCRKMVDLLLGYYVARGEPASSGSKEYLFPPNSVGPGRVNPLHLAASTQD